MKQPEIPYNQQASAQDQAAIAYEVAQSEPLNAILVAHKQVTLSHEKVVATMLDKAAYSLSLERAYSASVAVLGYVSLLNPHTLSPELQDKAAVAQEFYGDLYEWLPKTTITDPKSETAEKTEQVLRELRRDQVVEDIENDIFRANILTQRRHWLNEQPIFRKALQIARTYKSGDTDPDKALYRASEILSNHFRNALVHDDAQTLLDEEIVRLAQQPLAEELSMHHIVGAHNVLASHVTEDAYARAEGSLDKFVLAYVLFIVENPESVNEDIERARKIVGKFISGHRQQAVNDLIDNVLNTQ